MRGTQHVHTDKNRLHPVAQNTLLQDAIGAASIVLILLVALHLPSLHLPVLP